MKVRRIAPAKRGRLGLRLTEEELARWFKQAEAEGYDSLSAWVRDVCDERCRTGADGHHPRKAA